MFTFNTSCASRILSHIQANKENDGSLFSRPVNHHRNMVVSYIILNATDIGMTTSHYLSGVLHRIMYILNMRKTYCHVTFFEFIRCTGKQHGMNLHLLNLWIPRKSKDQTLPLGSRESFTWIILRTMVCLVLDFQGILV